MRVLTGSRLGGVHHLNGFGGCPLTDSGAVPEVGVVNRTTSDEDIGKLINNRQNGRRRGRGGGSGAPRPNGASGGQDRGNRIDNRARGNAAQLLEKYKALARDAQMQGDRVNTEYYLQFADHYFRVLSESRSRFEDQQPRPRRDEFSAQSDEEYGDEGERMGSDAPAPAAPERTFVRRDNERRDNGRDTERRDSEPQRGQAAEISADASEAEEEDRRPRRTRGPRNERRFDSPVPAPAPAPPAELPLVESVEAQPAPQAAPQPAAEEAAPVRRRGRPPKAKPSAEQIDADRLPPSLTLQAPAGDDAEEVRPRRTRKPRGETAAA